MSGSTDALRRETIEAVLALAAARLGFDTVVLEPEPDSPAGRVAARTIVASYDDAEGLRALAEVAQVVTFEFENVPAAAVAQLTDMGVDVAPGAGFHGRCGSLAV